MILFLQVYCLLCVISQYQEFKAGRGGTPHNLLSCVSKFSWIFINIVTKMMMWYNVKYLFSNPDNIVFNFRLTLFTMFHLILAHALQVRDTIKIYWVQLFAPIQTVVWYQKNLLMEVWVSRYKLKSTKQYNSCRKF